MKKIILLLLILFPLVCLSQKKTVDSRQSTVDSVKQDSIVTYVPTEFQMQAIQELQKQINELTKKEMDFILFGFGVAIDPKTLVFENGKFKAKKQ